MQNILTETLSGLTADDADTAEFRRDKGFCISVPASYGGASTVWDGATVAVKIQLDDGSYLAVYDTEGNEAVISEANAGKLMKIDIYGNEDYVFRVSGATANTVFPAFLVTNV